MNEIVLQTEKKKKIPTFIYISRQFSLEEILSKFVYQTIMNENVKKKNYYEWNSTTNWKKKQKFPRLFIFRRNLVWKKSSLNLFIRQLWMKMWRKRTIMNEIVLQTEKKNKKNPTFIYISRQFSLEEILSEFFYQTIMNENVTKKN